MLTIEYRVRPVTRYLVTRYGEYSDAEGRGCGSSSPCGEFDNEELAEKTAIALAHREPVGCVMCKVDPRYTTGTGSDCVHTFWAKELVIRDDDAQVSAPPPAATSTPA